MQKPILLLLLVFELSRDRAVKGQVPDIIDGGMTRQMIYHGDNGWKLEL